MSKEFDVSKRIMEIGNKVRRYCDASFADIGITGSQASILHFIHMRGEYGDVFQRDVEAEFDIRRSSVTNVLHGLERRGLVRRESVNEDARLKKLVLTDKAVEMHDHIHEIIVDINKTMLKQMKQHEIAYLENLLGQIEESLP